MINQIQLLTQLSLGQEGIALIDKPSGITSHDVIYQVRRKTGIKRVGHAGTLDPLASGLLIVLIGRQFTKQQDQFLKADKVYACTAQFGLVTDSYDIDGQVLKQSDWDSTKQLSEAQVLEAMENFKGEINQTVPAFSAVKIKGQKLYQLARKGQTKNLELPSKKVKIKNFELKKFTIDKKNKTATAEFEIFCSSGTYIRSLIHDLGQSLQIENTILGATVIKLRRLTIGDFKIEQAFKI